MQTVQVSITGRKTPRLLELVAVQEGITPDKIVERALDLFFAGRKTPKKDFRPDELALARGLSRRTIDREIKLWEYGDASHPKHTAGLGPVRRLRRAVIIPAESVAAWDARNDF